MRDYKLLAEGLRYCSKHICNKECGYYEICHRERQDKYPSNVNVGFDAADAIEELLAKDTNVPDKNVGEWISVEDELPDVATKVLTYNGDYVSENWMCTIIDKDGKRVIWAYSEKFVTHWMPLPAPPKEEN